jgi:hypothetical protein
LLTSSMRIGTQLSHAYWYAAAAFTCVLARSHVYWYAVLHFFRLAECDSESLVNYFLGHLRDSVPSARRDWLPPDTLQAELSRDVDVEMDLSVSFSIN